MQESVSDGTMVEVLRTRKAGIRPRRSWPWRRISPAAFRLTSSMRRFRRYEIPPRGEDVVTLVWGSKDGLRRLWSRNLIAGFRSSRAGRNFESIPTDWASASPPWPCASGLDPQTTATRQNKSFQCRLVRYVFRTRRTAKHPQPRRQRQL